MLTFIRSYNLRVDKKPQTVLCGGEARVKSRYYGRLNSRIWVVTLDMVPRRIRATLVFWFTDKGVALGWLSNRNK